jgi:hypothetical protein
MITLDPVLQTRMDSTNRRPMIDVIAQGAVSEIPFLGNLFTTESVNEKNPNLINHSSGRICMVYYFGAEGSHPYYSIKYAYSDTDQISYTTVTFANTDYDIIGIDICELSDTNIGIVWIERNTSTKQYQLKRKIITVTGVEVSSAIIASWAYGTYYTSGPTVCNNTNGTYILYYAKISGSDYYIYQRTSSDFITWSSESAVSLSGLTSTWKLLDPYVRAVPTLSSYDLIMAFAVVEEIGPNNEERSNIYYSVSSDFGTTWSAVTKYTNYTTFSPVATHPTIAVKQENNVYIAFNEKRTSLTMDSDTSGWPDNPNSWGAGSDPSNMHFDSVNRKLYVVNAYKGVGAKALQSVVKIDVDTWTIEDTWSTETTPALHSIWNSDHFWWKRDQGAGKYVPLSFKDEKFIQLIDGEADSIKTFAFEDIPAYSIVTNVSGYSFVGMLGQDNSNIWATFVDLANRRLWILSGSTYLYTHKYQVGYISLDDDGPTYSYVKVFDDNNWSESDVYGGEPDLKVYPDDDLIIVSTGPSGMASWLGICYVYRLSSGANLKRYRWDSDDEFPKRGINGNFYHNGHIYGGITYYNLYGQENIRGLLDITVDFVGDDDKFAYYRPSFASVDDYYLGDMVVTSDNKLLIASTVYGVVQYDINAGTWEQLNNTTIPGLTPAAADRFYTIAYDTEEELIFAGVGTEYAYTWAGWVCFSIYGEFNQAQYAEGNKIVSWGLEEATPLVSGILDYDAILSVDSTTLGITAFWVNRSDTEYSIKWGKDTGEFSLNKYIVTGSPVSVHRSVDGSPNTVSLTLSHGHLFDPYNLASSYRSILDKGKLIVVKFGENIDGTPYWVSQGKFHITSRRLRYKRGEYPIIEIEASDKRYIWKDKDIVATEYYDGQYPEYILQDIIEEFTSLTEDDFDIDDIDGRIEMDVQYTEMSLDEIIQEILDRFSYYLKITYDDKVSVGKIATDNDIDHTYSNSDQILEVSPEDSFSDFTNRVIVEGQERDYSDVLYDEELVATLNGTVGWWGFKKDFTVYYSNDQSKRVRNPRLVVKETTTSIGLQLAGNISESLQDNDPYEHYCTVTVTAPSLVPYLIAAIAAKMAVHYVPDIAPTTGGPTARIGTAIEGVLSIIIMLILGSMGNFQYEIYGLPVGEEKRSIQSPDDDADCNDTDCQTKIGYVVEKRIEEPFCYTVAECTQVARNEMAIIKAQRNGISISKISHLQDEEGDTIRFIHPVSGQAMDVFVTDMNREYTVPKPGVNEEASCIDNIEGWVLNQ